MQSDFHFCGTYALARAAGISRDAATVIARSAQYVDDAWWTPNFGRATKGSRCSQN